MNLAIDIGNTCTKLVAFNGTNPVEEVRLDGDYLRKTREFCGKYAFTRGIYSSVVRMSAEQTDAIAGLPFPMMRLVPGETPLPIVNRYATKKTLGSDRLAAAVGSYMESDKRHDILTIDVGTCITYDFTTSAGEYLGGNISPGPTIRFKALHAFTDSLPLVERTGGVVSALGDTTATAIRNGVMNGIEYEIEGCIAAFMQKYPGLLVYLTGGVELDLRISKKSCIFADKLIVPKGLNHILIYNGQRKRTA